MGPRDGLTCSPFLKSIYRTNKKEEEEEEEKHRLIEQSLVE